MYVCMYVCIYTHTCVCVCVTSVEKMHIDVLLCQIVFATCDRVPKSETMLHSMVQYDLEFGFATFLLEALTPGTKEPYSLHPAL